MPGVVGEGSGNKKKRSKSAWRRAQKKAKREGSVARSESVAPSEADSVAPSDVEESGYDTDTTTTSTVISDGMKIHTGDGPTHDRARAVDFMNVDDLSNQYDFDNPLFEQYKDVFTKFQQPTEEGAAKEKEPEKPQVYYEDDEMIQDEEQEEETSKKLSKRKMKEQKKLPLAYLRSIASRPDLVDEVDTSSSDPKLLVSIKSGKNIIPVPDHWRLKREYLSSKRGIEKPHFALPKFIQETGISEMREAVLEKQEQMSLRQKQRERVQGKLGKLDIDYQKLYEAFFRRQTKPELTRYGEVYYEGKEYETNLKHLKPGELSDELKDALSMSPGHPPPWLINQQRHGLPPSYPNLRIPGVNAPIPPGALWGYAPGQYGKPPVGDDGKPIWGGDPLGTAVFNEQQMQALHPGEPVERTPWGVLRTEAESEDEESDEEEEDEEMAAVEDSGPDLSGIQTSVTTASALPSEIGGTESIAGEFTLRKQRKGYETEEPNRSGPRSAYQVLPEKDAQATGFFGGEHVYDISAARKDRFGDSKKRKAGDIEVSVDLDALAEDGRMDKDALSKQYEAQKKAEAQGNWQSIDQDDLSEMIANESRKRQKRDEGRSRGGRR